MAAFCDPLRQQIKAVNDEIAALQDMLEHGDLPPQQRPKAKQELQKLLMLRPHVESVLTQCTVAMEGAAPAPNPDPPAPPTPAAPAGSNPPS